MKSYILSSGSKGNITYVETKNHKILIDMGKNLKYIEDALNNIGVLASSIDIILISHTHNDHISALDSFLEKYKPIVCLSVEMVLNLPSLDNYEHIIIYDDEINFDDLNIKAIKSSHDSVGSRNFIIECDGKTLVQITDTGYIRSKYFDILRNKDVYFLESNHDIEMLNDGPYPPWLKKRVLSDEGHLSNLAAGSYLAKFIGDNTKEVYLMHLSEVNNTEEKALDTVFNVLNSHELNFSNIKCAKQDKISELIKI